MDRRSGLGDLAPPLDLSTSMGVLSRPPARLGAMKESKKSRMDFSEMKVVINFVKMSTFNSFLVFAKN